MSIELVKINNDEFTQSCYFRTGVKPPYKKVYLEINNKEKYISFRKMIKYVLPNFKKSNVVRVTLVGDNVLGHPNIVEIVNCLSESKISVCVNSNSLNISEYLVLLSSRLGNVHYNFNFEELLNIYDIHILDNKLEKLASLGLVNGISVSITEHNTLDEYYELFKYFKNIGIKYIYLNADNISFALDKKTINDIKDRFNDLNDSNFEIFYVRFPNSDKIGKCHLGKVLSISVDGNVGLCPHIINACNNQNSKYKPQDFIIDNIFKDTCDITTKMISYDLPVKNIHNVKCDNIFCTKGCYAAKIAKGLDIFECDIEICSQYKK